MEEKKKEIKKIYRLTVWSHYEEDDGELYYVDFDSMLDALNAKEGYESELTLSGQRAYSVCGPDIVPEEQYILIKTNGEFEEVFIDREHFLDECYKLIGCELIEICVPNFSKEGTNVRFIIDESGKINDQVYNPLATLFYNF